MPAYISTLIYLMALGTVILDAAIAVGILASFNRNWRAKVASFIRGNSYLLVIALSVLSIAGTLLMQYAGNLTPCVLCWWQRIFMYPVAIVALVAFVKNVKFSAIADYVIWLSIPGALIALYQHLLQVLPQGALIPCDASNDCAIRSVFDFGFVTIPWMALSVFAALLLIAIIARKDSPALVQ